MNTQELKRMDEKVSENEEMDKLFNFLKKYKNLLIALAAAVVIAIFLYDYYQKSEAEGKVLAQDKLYEISKLFGEKNFDAVVEKGEGYAKNYSGYLAADEIKVYVAKAHGEKGNIDGAISALEGISSKNGLVSFAKYNLLGIYYQNRFLVKNDKNDALKSADYFEKSGTVEGNIFADEAIYNAAYSLYLGGELERSKKILEGLKERKYDVNPRSIKDRVEDLLFKF